VLWLAVWNFGCHGAFGFSGLLDRYPQLKIITLHLGGMIPTFDGRVGPGMQFLGCRTTAEDHSKVLSSLKRPHLEYFKMFYGDTAMFGCTAGLHSGMAFFGADHVVFATDAPFAPIGATIKALDALQLNSDDRRKICLGNGAGGTGIQHSPL
jgi:predicted TIM-barrel fold metal-dependent hydrolase